MSRAKKSVRQSAPIPEPPPPAPCHPCENGFPDKERVHQVAKCRWCGGPFIFVWGEQWVCKNIPCAERQVRNALKKQAEIPGDSPFLFLPLPLQVEIEDSPIKRLAVWGPVGISKSYGLRMHLYARCRKIPGYRALLLRATSDQLYKNHLQFMADEARQLGDAEFKMGGGKIPPQMGFPDIDSIVFMGHLQDRGDIAQHMGPEWDEVDVDEANHVITEGLQKVTSRDRGSKPSYKARMKMGIDEGRTRLLLNVGGISWSYIEDFYIEKNVDRNEFEEYNPDHYGSITGNLEDNPYLTVNMRSSVLGGLDRATRKQFADGDRTAIPGQFFTAFNRSEHERRKEPSKDATWGAGMRWSQSAKGWVGFCAAEPDGFIIARHELVFTRMSPERVAADIKAACRQWGIPVPVIYTNQDVFPASDEQGESIAETFRRAGVPLRPASADRVNAFSRTRSWLDPARIAIHPDCAYLLRTMPTLLEHDTKRDDIKPCVEEYPAVGLTNYLMSRPVPGHIPEPEPPKGSIYWDVKELRDNCYKELYGVE